MRGGKRESDQNVRAAINDWMTENRLAVTVGTWVLVAAGFGFRTPAQTTNELRAEIKQNRIEAKATTDTLRAQISAGVALNPADWAQMREDIRTLLVLRCLDNLSQRERAISHLTLDRCSKL